MIKWIKGALIGQGSFGSVFLGMDAQSGLLMAVKQVELPSGDARNEEKKRNMVQALEREIELLKELQHENIVQYLGQFPRIETCSPVRFCHGRQPLVYFLGVRSGWLCGRLAQQLWRLRGGSCS